MPIKLPQVSSADFRGLEKSIEERRSCREYSVASLTARQLASLLWVAQGVTSGSGQRAAPSAGAQYPMEIYAIAGRVDDMSPGAYRYHAADQTLDRVVEGDLRPTLFDAALDDQPWVKQAALIIVLTADFAAMQTHFHEQPPRGQRGERYIYLESGAIAQNIGLQSTSLGLGAVIVGGFDDDQVSAALKLPPGIKPTTLICIGARE